MRIIIKDINLTDDATGGKANIDVTLAEFITGAEPDNYSLAAINRELRACSIEPITLDQIWVDKVLDE